MKICVCKLTCRNLWKKTYAKLIKTMLCIKYLYRYMPGYNGDVNK